MGFGRRYFARNLVQSSGELFVLRVNAGSAGQIETSMGTFINDAGYYSGNTASFSTSNAIANTIDDNLYQTERNGQNTIVYTFSSIPNGNYTIRLHFCELYWGGVGGSPNGRRLFDVTINSVLFLDDYDPFIASGGKFIAVIETTTRTVTSGTITIELVSSIDRSSVVGIEIIQTS